MSENHSLLVSRKKDKKNLFVEISERVNQRGKMCQEDVAALADKFLVGESTIYGTASFYDFLNEHNQGKRVHVCSGTACAMAKTQEKLRKTIGKHLATEDEIGEVCCLGRCHENGAFHYQGKNYSNLSEDKIAALMRGAATGPDLDGKDHYYVGSNMANPILTSKHDNLEIFKAAIKKLITSSRGQIIEEVKKSRLRGRGGAGFPMGIKLEGAAKAQGEIKYVVCNGDEGDPGAYSDRYLLEQQPYLVVFGMIAAGYAIGATKGYIYIRKEYPQSIANIRKAISEFEAAAIVGKNIGESNYSYELEVIEGQGAYICGEETSLLASIEGQRPIVRTRPPYPVHQGLFLKPTVVNNVETIASLFYILEHGGDTFASIGTIDSSGSKLVSLDSSFNRPGIYEVAMGTLLTDVIEKMGLGLKQEIKAMQIGGPLGGVVPVSKIENLAIEFASFAKNGFLLGHASVVSIPHDFPIIQFLHHLFAFVASESCGKCFPCRLGATRGMELLVTAISGSEKISIDLFNDLLDTLEQASLCALGGGLPLPIKNCMCYFQDELASFFMQGRKS